jgi:hypothetical protein
MVNFLTAVEGRTVEASHSDRTVVEASLILRFSFRALISAFANPPEILS